MVVPIGAFAAALLFVTIVAGLHHTALAWLSAILLFGTAVALGACARRERMRSRDVYDVGRARLTVSAVMAGAGVLVMIVNRVAGPDAIGFVALGIVIVAGGGVVSEIRQSRWHEGRRGPVVLGVAFFVTALGIVREPAGHVVPFVLVGIVLAELGAEVFSEDYLRTTHRWGRWPVAALGLGLVLVAGGLLVANGSGAWAALVLLVFIVLVVWMAAADSDSLLLVVVVAVALLWAASPQPAAHDPHVEAVAGEPFVLVLGDSYISGEGASAFLPGTNSTAHNADFTNECRRAPTAWPFDLARAGIPQFPRRVMFLPCSGAETRHIRATAPTDASGRQNGPGELVQYQQERARLGMSANDKPAFVLLSLGGNDAGFGTIGPTCVRPGDCAEIAYEFLDGLKVVEQRLDQSYADIKTVVGADVPVVVTGYPIPITEHGPCASVLLTEHERRFVVAFVKELNRVVQSAATRAGFEYMDSTENALVDAKNRLCEPGNPVGMNFIGFNPKAGSLWDTLNPLNWVHNSLHPNEIGHQAIADAAAKWFADHPTRHAPVATNAPPHQVASMSDLFEFGFTRLCDPQGDRSCDITHDGWANDQTLRLAQLSLLPFTVAIVGAWMIVIGGLGWAAEHDVSLTTFALRIGRWVGDRFR